MEAVHRRSRASRSGCWATTGRSSGFRQPEEAERAPDLGRPGLTDVRAAFVRLAAAGVGFGERTAAPGAFYDVRQLRRRTPDPADVNTRMLD